MRNRRRLGGVVRELHPYGRLPVTEVPMHGQMVPGEGPNEPNYVRVLDLDRTVTQVTAQPVKIPFCFWPGTTRMALLGPVEATPKDAVRASATPDYLVEREDRRPELVEVKWFKALVDERVQRKIAAGRAYAAERGWDYLLVRSDELNASAELRNIRFLWQYRRVPPTASIRMQALGALRAAGCPVPVAVLVEALASTRQDQNECQEAVWSMIAHRELAVDFSQRLTTDSLVGVA